MRIIEWAALAALAIGCGDSGGNGASSGGSDSGSSRDGGSADKGGDKGGNTGGSGKASGGGSCGTAVSSNACPDGCNPCSRLSDAQVAKVVGQPAVKGQWDSDACLWDFNDDKGDPSFEVGFHINTDYATFEDICHPGSMLGFKVTPVSGVGDEACYLETQFGSLGSFELNFLKGCWAYSISVAGPAGKAPPFSDASARDYEKALAIDAVAKL